MQKDFDWNSFDRGVFLINCLAIVYKNGKILIGKREWPDPYIKEVNWSFPGGRPTYDRSLEESLKDEVKKKTGLDVEVKKLIFVRTLPEKKEFMCLYYYCEPIGGIEKAGEKFKEIKWIKPTDILKYSKISTSIDPFIFNFLKKIRGR